MSHITLRVSDEEKQWIKSYADMSGISISEAIKSVFFKSLEDEYDLDTIRDYEKAKEEGKVNYYSLDEVKGKLDYE